jgi:hypothetical protein
MDGQSFHAIILYTVSFLGTVAGKVAKLDY